MPMYFFIVILVLTIGADIITMLFRKKYHKDKSHTLKKLYRTMSIILFSSIIILNNNDNILVTVVVYSVIALMLVLIAFNEFMYRRSLK